MAESKIKQIYPFSECTLTLNPDAHRAQTDYIYIKKCGNIIEIHMDIELINNNLATSTIATIPIGFRPNNYITFIPNHFTHKTNDYNVYFQINPENGNITYNSQEEARVYDTRLFISV